MNKRERLFDMVELLEKCEDHDAQMVHLAELRKELRNQKEISQNDAEQIMLDLIRLLPSEGKPDCAVELLGSIFNILAIQEELRDIAFPSGFLDFLADMLRKQSLLSKLQLSVLRIIFIVSSSQKGAQNLLPRDEIVEKIIVLTEQLIQKTAEKAREHLLCCIHILYNLIYRCTVPKDKIESIFGLVLAISETEDMSPRILTAAYALILGMNTKSFSSFTDKQLKENKGRKTFISITEDILAHTEKIFRFYRSLDVGEEPGFDIEVEMSTLSCILEKICRENEAIRKELAKQIIPYPRDLQFPATELSDLRGLFSQELLSKNLELKTSVGELFFTLCKKKTARFVYHVGLGRAAATLLEKNLFNVSVQGSFVSSDEEPVDKYPESYDIVAGRLKDGAEEESLAYEEREKEKEEIADLFENLSSRR